ncbi:MAG: alpha-galactosidase [Alphaproteobacteria bacterium]|nr:MAG: alpha-galactosidase [Alphaproteobacteria bacterium]
MAPRLGRGHRRGAAAGGDVLPHAAALHRRADAGGGEVTGDATGDATGRETGTEARPGTGRDAGPAGPDGTDGGDGADRAALSGAWRLDDGRQTLVVAARGGLPFVVHWGAPLAADEDLDALTRASRPDVTGGMMDAPAAITLCPDAAAPFPGHPGLRLRAAGGRALHPRLRLTGVRATGTQLHFTAEDAGLGLVWTAEIALDPATGTLALSAALAAATPVIVDWLAAPVLPLPAGPRVAVEFAGRWCREFQPVHRPLCPGLLVRHNPTGRTGHEHFPGLLVTTPGAGPAHGEVHAFHYGWSGGHMSVVEELPDGRRQVQFGAVPGAEPAALTRARTATLYATWSGAGTQPVARAFQRLVRDRLVPWTAARPATARPVHYNCWEAVYFDHDPATLRDIAARAARLGAERFVLDDGWFGRRDDDTTSLGDWQVDRRKWPDGLGPFADHVRKLGMSFGIWFEPEMISPDSALARAHPDWILGPADQPKGRHQLVLDMARPAVQAHLFDAISAILTETRADYVKWDHNRVLPWPDAAQTRGVWALLDRLRAAHPDVEWESCASGGGRIDYGMLARTHRVWLSDSNDAIERQRIQHHAALFLPAAVTGSHVGPRVCHTSGRVLPMAFRAWTAAARHMGFEMDPRELTAEEADTLAAVTRWWKANRDWLLGADILPLETGDPAVLAELHLAPDAARFVLFAAVIDSPAQILPRPVPLSGLDPAAHYECRALAPEALPALSRGEVALKDGPVTASGAALASVGLTLPWAFPATVHVVEGRRLGPAGAAGRDRPTPHPPSGSDSQ